MPQKDLNFVQAINEGLKEEMRRDDHVIILGEEVGAYGGDYKVTEGLMDEFGPERVRDTPISEAAIVGAALGASLVGFRPVAEIMFMDFLTISLDQLMSHASKMRFMSGGQVALPMVVRTQFSLGRGYGAQHSQFFPSLFLQTPGIKVVLPATPKDAKGLIKSSIRENNPVLFIEPGVLYFMSKAPVPEGEYLTPIGKADVKREGTDITIVAYSRTVLDALAAADVLARKGISAEVVDLMSIQPMDYDTVLKSVSKTNRLVIADDSVLTGGVSAEIAAHVVERSFDILDAPIRRVNAPPMPAPYGRELDAQYIVSRDKIVAAVLKLLGRPNA
jgi:pyruvate/2-oxoglutarate/acetoin dehydrogenase E1 component